MVDTTTRDGGTDTTTYDGASRVATTETAAGRTFTKTIDAKGRLVASAVPGSAPLHVHVQRGRAG